MRVLVTGGAGFIGSHIVDQLVRDGHHITVIDNLSTGLMSNLNKEATFIEMDIRSAELIDVFNREQFEAVIHQAAQTMVPKSLEDPRYDCDVNIMGTVHILEACRATGVKKIVFASSAAVYGDKGQIPIEEHVHGEPSSFYGLSKLTIEKYLALYQQLYGIEYAALRYANVYGERQGDGGEGGVISIFTRKISASQGLDIFGTGTQTRDFIYAGDVAQGNVKALMPASLSGVYNISTGSETSVNKLIELLSEIAGQQATVQHHPVREGDIYRSALSNKKAQAGLQWLPQMDLREGLSRTYQSLQRNNR